MFATLHKFAPQILGITRILLGVMLACHGAQKVLGAFGGPPAGAPALVVWGAGTIELVFGCLLAVGLLARFSGFLLSGLMAFAYFMGHASKGFWPIENHGELAVVYCWMSLYVTAQGPGAFALDHALRARHPSPALDVAEVSSR